MHAINETNVLNCHVTPFLLRLVQGPNDMRIAIGLLMVMMFELRHGDAIRCSIGQRVITGGDYLLFDNEPLFFLRQAKDPQTMQL